MRIIEVTCRYNSGAYVTQTVRGQRASATMSSEQAVRRLADKLYPGRVRTVTLLGHGDELLVDRWRIEADEEPAPHPAPDAAPHTAPGALAATLLCLLLVACGGGDPLPDSMPESLLVQGPGVYPDCPSDPYTFVGPLLPQCIYDQLHTRRTILPVQCTDLRECRL